MTRRADALRNERTLLDAAAEVFVARGVNAPVRDIAGRAGVGVGTIYRHFPSRSELIVAVYRHQVDVLVADASDLLTSTETPLAALRRWMDHFADFLVTKHGLAGALQTSEDDVDALHGLIRTTLVPACQSLIDAAISSGNLRTDIDGLTLLRAAGNLCVGAEAGRESEYYPRALINLLITGLAREQVPGWVG